MRLGSPHIWVQRRRIQPVTIGLALALQHQLAQLRHRKLARLPPLEDRTLEQEAAGDVHHDLARPL